MRNTLIILCLFGCLTTSFGQLRISEGTNTSGNNSMAFIDGSSSSSFNAFFGASKGILFPRTDLTQVATSSASHQVFDRNSIGSITNNPNYYDGLVVFNTGSGPIPADGMGTSAKPVSLGFYYYRNTSSTWNGGTWIPMDSSSSATAITLGTPRSTGTRNAAGDEVLVVQLTGVTNGTTTEIDLTETADLPINAVKQFRRADIYNAAGVLVMMATGAYNSATNVVVTGNGSFNTLLPAANDYTVELYYTAN
ncbi:MAG: hypothetical protein GKR88_04955 [Flavobacteriaceae bacterium]|nr:MAG: hypothetical protein GKR88_04955 [Flavobacteriaceae bacterium]